MEAKKNINTKKKLTKDDLIKKEIRRLKGLLKKLELDDNRMKTALSLVENAAFMSVTLDYLKCDINKNGVVSKYKNGENQWGTKKSPEIEIYNTMIKNHMSILKQLMDLFPKEQQKEIKDGFDNFVNGRD